MWKRRFFGLLTVSTVAWSLWPARWAVNVPLPWLPGSRTALSADALREQVRIAEGFTISLYASGLEGARSLRATPTGDLLVSRSQSGSIEFLGRDADGDGRPDARRVLLDQLDQPFGIDFVDGWLYIAETGAVGRIQFDAEHGTVSGAYERLLALPAGGQHWSRSLRVGPDGWIYVSIGSSCNVCSEADPRRATLLRMSRDGHTVETVATGLRNTVGFDWQPGTGDLYGTDNGRDLLGDDQPPCELNKLGMGGFYGWPYAYGDRQPDPEYGAGHAAEIASSVAPAFAFKAHNAPLGISFLRWHNWPAAYRNAALVALHGSWNRSRKDGYKVVSLHFDDNGRIAARDFLTGFLRDDEVSGRPVDIAEDSIGNLYVSDDYTGSIYRITRAP